MRQLSTLQKPSSPVMNLAKRSVKSWRMNKKTGEKSCEARYFITSVDDGTKAAVALRSHWGIENNLHWVLDVVFDEDFSTVRKVNSA